MFKTFTGAFFARFYVFSLTKLTLQAHTVDGKKIIRICSQIPSRSVACMSDPDMLISVPVTSNMAVGRTGHSLNMPFRINVLP